MTLQVVSKQPPPPLTEKEWETLGISPDQKPAFDTDGTAYIKLEKFLKSYSKVKFPTSLTNVMYHHEKPHRDLLCYSCKLLYASMVIGTGVSQVVSFKTPVDKRPAIKAEAYEKACQNAVSRIQEATDKYFKPKEESK